MPIFFFLSPQEKLNFPIDSISSLCIFHSRLPSEKCLEGLIYLSLDDPQEFFEQHLNNYFDFHVCLSIRPSVRVPCVRNLTPLPAVLSQNIFYKSCLVCIKCEKYTSWVTLRPHWDCCRRGKAEVRIYNLKKTLPPQSRSQAVVCVSTPRKYPRSGYFLVMLEIDFRLKNAQLFG